MNEDYETHLRLLKAARAQELISQVDYLRIYEEMMDADGEDLDNLLVINADLLTTIEAYKKQIICGRLVIGAQKIEDTMDPKEKARLMVHYNNLLKELGA